MKKIVFIVLSFLIIAVIVYVSYRVFFLSKNAKGALQVTSVPESTVYLNDNEIGVTPLCICGADVELPQSVSLKLTEYFGVTGGENLLPVGEYTIRLVPKDTSFPEFQEKISIGQSVLAVVDRTFGQGAESEGSVITLEKTNSSSPEILVLSVPNEASVYLDSEAIGSSPVSKSDVTESDHELRLSKNGYIEKAVRIKAANGYKLIAKIYMGVDTQAVTGQATSEAESLNNESSEEIGELEVSQVVILPTGTGFLRVREGPSLGTEEVGRVTPDEVYPLISEETDWYQIEFEEGSFGFISKEYAELVVE